MSDKVLNTSLPNNLLYPTEVLRGVFPPVGLRKRILDPPYLLTRKWTNT